MRVFELCGDEWITAGMNGDRIAIAGPSIEAAMNALGIKEEQERLKVYSRVKMASRAIVQEIIKERAKKEARGESE